MEGDSQTIAVSTRHAMHKKDNENAATAAAVHTHLCWQRRISQTVGEDALALLPKCDSYDLQYGILYFL